MEQQFDIQAKTCRLMATMTQSDGKASILDNRTKYTIPIYQREYSWGWEQISRFVGDIFKGFWGAEEEKRNDGICVDLV